MLWDSIPLHASPLDVRHCSLYCDFIPCVYDIPNSSATHALLSRFYLGSTFQTRFMCIGIVASLCKHLLLEKFPSVSIMDKTILARSHLWLPRVFMF